MWIIFALLFLPEVLLFFFFFGCGGKNLMLMKIPKYSQDLDVCLSTFGTEKGGINVRWSFVLKEECGSVLACLST